MKTKILGGLLLVTILGVGYCVWKQKSLPISEVGAYSIYKADKHYFTFKYPSDADIYIANPSETSWPHAIVLMRFLGSQAYDLAIEEWDTEEEAKAIQPDLIREKGGVYITFKNQGTQTGDPAKNKIIEDIIKSAEF